ncbi:MAG: hypothetical protein R2882_09350 [Gemmatimonadales bacterium]
MPRSLPLTALLGAAALLTARPAEAQLGFLDKVFANVEDINAFGSAGRLIGNDWLKGGLTGFAAEVTFGVGRVGCVNYTDEDVCGLLAARREAAERRLAECRRNGLVAEYAAKCEEPDFSIDAFPESVGPAWGVELGLGYRQVNGFSSRRDDVAIQGYLEELPSIAAYFAYHPTGRISGYAGFRTGVVRLAGLRGTVTANGNTHSAAPTSFQLGVLGGVAVGNDAFSIFADVDLTSRRFASVEWSTTPGTIQVPAELPRSLQFSTISLNAGFQLRFRAGN